MRVLRIYVDRGNERACQEVERYFEKDLGVRESGWGRSSSRIGPYGHAMSVRQLPKKPADRIRTLDELFPYPSQLPDGIIVKRESDCVWLQESTQSTKGPNKSIDKSIQTGFNISGLLP
jgi:DNA-binding PucR family transcriptional regulator